MQVKIKTLMSLTVILASTMLTVTNASAADRLQHFFKVTGNALKGDALEVDLLVDPNGHVSSMQYTRLRTAGTTFTSKPFSVKEMQSGAVLDSENGMGGTKIAAVTLIAKDFNPATGGSATLHYLINGVSPSDPESYGDFPLEIAPEGSVWKVKTKDQNGIQQPFSEMNLEKNAIFFGKKIIGIKSISVH